MNQTLVKMAADVWLIILAAALIVNVLWDSEELPARVGLRLFLKCGLILVALEERWRGG